MIYMLAKKCQQRPRGRTTGPRPPLHCAQNRITPASRESARRIHTAQGRNTPRPPNHSRVSVVASRCKRRLHPQTPALTWPPGPSALPRPHTSCACPITRPRIHQGRLCFRWVNACPCWAQPLTSPSRRSPLTTPLIAQTPPHSRSKTPKLSSTLGRAKEGL